MREQSAGDVDYERRGNGYAAVRRADPRFAAFVHRSLGDARTVVNVGAGAGSYEPTDRHVVAVEPSATMRAQRPRHLAPALDATVPIHADCTDGFAEAFYARSERLLDPAVRRAQSAWALVDADTEARFVHRLGDDLASGTWDERYGHLRTQPSYDGALRLVTALPPA
jgi:hypothetical protein